MLGEQNNGICQDQLRPPQINNPNVLHQTGLLVQPVQTNPDQALFCHSSVTNFCPNCGFKLRIFEQERASLSALSVSNASNDDDEDFRVCYDFVSTHLKGGDWFQIVLI